MRNKKNDIDSSEQKAFNGAMTVLDTPISYSIMQGRDLLKEGYVENVIVYRSVNRIIDALTGIKVKIVGSDNKELPEAKTKDIFKLMNRPNPVDGKSSFLKKTFINRLVLGEMFISASTVNGKPKELWNFDPLEMTIVPGNHIPKAYIHEVSGDKVTFPVDVIDGKSEMFFWKGENPLDKWRGMSPLFAASLATDTNNAGLRWNHSLLKNGSRTSGLVTFTGKPNEAAFAKMKKWWADTFQGVRNSGAVAFLWGETKYQELGKSPKDMDFVKTLDMTTAFIATAYGVPLPLVMNDAATFNNMGEAKTMFYTDTVIPVYGDFLECFGNWLLPQFDLEDAKMIIDEDSIPALEPVRAKRRESMTKLVGGSVITPNEARKELNYDEKPGAADELYMSANNLPLNDVDNDDGGDDET